MLSFFFSLFFLILVCVSWEMAQFCMFLLSFFFSILISHDFNMTFVGFGLGIDYLSYILILLSFWITCLVLSASHSVYKYNNFKFLFIMMNVLLLFFLVVTFSCMNYLSFYISFEASLIPTLILILGWGYQPERIQAGIYFIFYTMFASLPLLVSILSMHVIFGSSCMHLSLEVLDNSTMVYVWYLMTVFAFIVKLPMFMVHLWLPKAHVEAPVAGSMILAGVLLKLGGYGLIRVLPIFLQFNKSLSWVWMSISVVGGVITSFMCLRQIDMKSLIAYSSVAHMGLVLCGLVVVGSWGLSGAVVVMVGHGLCSSGLFCLANMVYERLSSRSLLIGKGLMNFMPSMGLWWFLLIAGNMAAPPTLNFLGEVSLIISVVGWSKVMMIGIALLSFFSAAYSLYMYSLSQHGKFHSSLFSCCSGKVREYLILMLHWLPLNILVLNGGLVLVI
uniref:NADH-ubiquinone oxidoreductase chain 4 n=1 Tax=Pseudeuphausia sinica TaxID=296748 RepID=A0A5Q2MZ03_9EUCA|nr:NADH dehydrogenase subunit 4 [Pseudeuphausia sinica]QGG46162.1 NADH dehydrogenase subunit 4 [Pseudeuphausia sinica]